MRRRRGSSMVEAVIASTLVTALTLILAELGASHTRQAALLTGRTRVLVEALVVYRHLAADAAGAEAVTWDGNGGFLRMRYPGRDVHYRLEGSRLMRRDGGNEYAVAVVASSLSVRESVFGLVVEVGLDAPGAKRVIRLRRSFGPGGA